ncbi:MAG: polysaccharide deacetylase family protein [Micromonosporaceae bacterium]|nr:polysaccharide deacetylase family protein [Micromonosporaceae bacterium]
MPEAPELPIDEQAPRIVEFGPGPVTSGTNIPRWVGEGGRLHPGARAGALEVVWQVNAAEKLIALTFDDGPVPGVSEVLYDILDETGIKATLFVVGQRVEEFGDLMRGRVDRHEIGNHTYSHTSTFTKTDAEIEEDLTAAHQAIAEVLGREARLFRPPYSHVNGGTLVAAAQLGYDLVMWNNNIGYLGYDGEEDRLVRDVVETVFPGSIVLCHDGGPEYLISIRSVPKIVSELKAQGYEFVTISELREASKA